MVCHNIFGYRFRTIIANLVVEHVQVSQTIVRFKRLSQLIGSRNSDIIFAEIQDLQDMVMGQDFS